MRPRIERASAPGEGGGGSGSVAGGLGGSANHSHNELNAQAAPDFSARLNAGIITNRENRVRVAEERDSEVTQLGSADPVAETAARLAKLPYADYERRRRDESERLGVRLSILDRAVKFASRETGGTRKRWQPNRATPCAEVVDGKAVLGQVADAARQHLHLPRHADTIIALWTVHTYLYDAQPHTPRLSITSATRGCGKTTVVDFLSLIVQAPKRSDSTMVSAIFRLVEAHHPTLLLDELDNRFGEADDLRRILNSGWQRGGMADRVEEIGGERQVVSYDTYAPAALCAIGRLPSTLEDRAISLRMQRARPGEVKARLRTDRPEEWTGLRARLARLAEDIKEQVRTAEPDLPGAHNRQADKWRIIVAIADVVGGVWPSRAREAMAAEMKAQQAADDGDAGVMLLADIRELFDARATDRQASAEIAEALAGMEDRPWPEWRHARPISTLQLARLLAPYSIAPNTIRIGTSTAKGYRREQFEETWCRYLPANALSDPSQRHSSQTSAENERVESVTSGLSVPDCSSPTAPQNGACDGVTDENPDDAEEDEPMPWEKVL